MKKHFDGRKGAPARKNEDEDLTEVVSLSSASKPKAAKKPIAVEKKTENVDVLMPMPPEREMNQIKTKKKGKGKASAIQGRANLLNDMAVAKANLDLTKDTYSDLNSDIAVEEEEGGRDDLMGGIRTFNKKALKPAMFKNPTKRIKAPDDYNFEEDEDYEIPKAQPMTFDYRKLYSDHLTEGAEALPIHKLKYLILQINARSDTTLDFSGVSVLTDITFALLADLMPKEGARLKAVTNVSLDGCHQITDGGLAWLGKAFPNLTWLSCVGCSLVTNQGILALCDLCPKLTPTLDLSGTQVTMLPRRLGNGDGLRASCTPLLYPRAPADVAASDKKKDPAMKPEGKDLLGVYIAHYDAKQADLDLLGALQGKKRSAAGSIPPVQYKSNVPLTNDITAFVVEAQRSLAPLFISGRSVVVIPSTLTDKTQISSEATSIASLVVQIRAKYADVPIILVGCSTNDKGIVPTAVVAEQVTDIVKAVGDTLSDKYPVLSSSKKDEVLENTSVPKQLELSQAVNLMERTKQFKIFDLEINLDKDVTPLVSMIADLAKKSPSLKDMTHDKEIYDWALSFPDKCPSTLKSGVMTLEKAAQAISDNSTFKERLRPFGAVHFLRDIGQFSSWESQDKGMLVANNDWMCSVLNILMSVSSRDDGKNNGGLYPVIDDVTPVWPMDALKEEMAKVKVGWDQFEEMIKSLGNIFVSNDKVVTPWTSLPMDSTMTLDLFTNFDKDAKDPTSVHLMMSFALDINVSPGILHSILHYAKRIQTPIHMWQTGAVFNDSVVSVMIGVTGYTKLLNLCAYMPYSKDNPVAQADLIWSTFNRYKIIIQYMLAVSGLQAETILRASKPLLPAPAKVGGMVTNHKMKPENIDGMCVECGVPVQEAVMLSNFNKLLEPSFCNEKSVKTKHATVAGSMINFTGVGDAQFTTYLSPIGNNECTFTLIQGAVKNLSIVIRSHNPNFSVVMALNEKQVTVADKEQTKNYSIADKLGGGTLQGCVFKAKLKGSGPFFLDLYMGPRLLFSTEVPYSRYQIAVDGQNLKDGEGVVASITVSDILFFPHTPELKVGMKLEALDRKTPTLICVATIDDIKDDKFLIHFDGWSRHYDFWTQWDSDDLHPLGYMAHMRETNGHKRRVNKSLQIPNGYNKPFSWPTYLEEKGEKPVPYEYFSESQTQGTPSTATDEAQNHLGIFYDVGNKDLTPCSKRLTRSTKYKRLAKDAVRKAHDEELDTSAANLYMLLPSSLSVNSLRYPVMKDLMDIRNMNLHCLCDWQAIDFHFTNHPGLPVGKTPLVSSDKWSYSQLNACIALLRQKETLPVDPSAMIAGSEKLPTEKIAQLELGLKRILLTYVAYGLIVLVLKGQTTDSSPELDRVAKEMMTTALEKDRKFAENFLPKPGSDGIICHAHKLADSPMSSIQEIKMDSFNGMAPRMYQLNLSNNPLTSLPGDLFKHFNNMTRLLLNSCQLSELPPFSPNVSLTEIDVRNNNLSSLPDDIDNLKDLKVLQIAYNPLGSLPSKISSLKSLVHLAADNIGSIDMNLVCNLTSLTWLTVSHNYIPELPANLGDLPLQTLYMGGLPVFPTGPSFRASTVAQTLSTIHAYKEIPEKDRQEMVQKAETLGENRADTINEFNKVLREKFAPFTKTKGFKEGEFPPAIFQLKQLQTLHMSDHTFTTVPDNIKELKELKSLNVESNPRLESVSPELANLPLKELHLRDCPLLKTPPKEVVRRGFAAVFGFLKRLLQGSVLCKRTKLMMVGLGGAGKTSLVRALTNKNFQYNESLTEEITDGIDITEWSVNTAQYPEVNDESNDKPLRFSVWDFAGQTVYYNTHQFFLSNRAVYLLLWNIRLGFEHAGLDFWLSSVTCHAPKAPIVIVGTHCDKVEKGKLPTEELKRKFPKIVAFHFVSSYTGEGIANLRLEVIKSALQQNYMGEKIPEAWLSLEVGLDKVRGKKSLIRWEEIEDVANTAGIFDKVELTQSVQFLHDLGSVQFFNTPFLKSHVVIVPQWIVDVMACIVTVHDGPTKEGKLHHKDMDKVWKDYPKELHPWLLRLTEEFDLTFPISNQDANVVPCLLPTSEPKFEFPPVNKDQREREAQMVYRFEYLPAGLFNRVQVRLHQFSDTSLMWKKGFMLKKNGHRALLLQMSATEVDVTARGYKPENTIFLIHEVIECLVADSYAGVSYDFSLPCLDCASNYTLEPSMFHASKVKRAVDMKAPFLQCDKYFHVISIPEIRAAMPPDRQSDFDEHLGRSVRELQALEEGVAIKCLFVYSKKNVPDLAQEGKVVNPVDVLSDLRKNGFNVSYCDDPETANMESMTLAIKSAQMVIICISDDFNQSEKCRDLIIYTKKTLNKPITLVSLGKTSNWQKTDINLILADEVFVRMYDCKQYESKLKELKEAVKNKVLKKKVTYPECFISYCWANSKSAVELGTPEKEGAIGWADPRKIKDFLQDKGVDCWLDVNQMGQEGFFEDIAEGLRKAKVMVACVSDEYAISKNCKMEFRFALSTLKIPTVLAVVGTGYMWERSEIGLLTVGHGNSCPKINLQYPNEGGMLDLLKAVQSLIPAQDQGQGSSEKDLKSQQDVAFQEVLELAQRKLLRQIMMYETVLGVDEFPRLILVDLKSNETKRPATSRTPRSKDPQEERGPDSMEAEKSDTYCYRLFCEHEMGWHESPETIPFPAMEGAGMSDFLKSVSAYTVRLIAILKHTKSQLHILNTPSGEQLQKKMEEWCNRTNSDFKDEYQVILNSALGEDSNQTFGGLKRCNMPNKKVLWLCPEHERHSLTQTDDKFKDKTGTPGQEPAGGDAGAAASEDTTDFETDSFVDTVSDTSSLRRDTPNSEVPTADRDQIRAKSIKMSQPARGPALPPSRPKLNRHTSGKKTSQSQACRLM